MRPWVGFFNVLQNYELIRSIGHISKMYINHMYILILRYIRYDQHRGSESLETAAVVSV